MTRRKLFGLFVLALAVSGEPREGEGERAAEPLRNFGVLDALYAVITAQPIQSPSGWRVDTQMNGVRGGNSSGMPLGCWCGGKRIEFKSPGYLSSDQRTVTLWAYDLHDFIIKKGGGWENVHNLSDDNEVGRTILPFRKIRDDFAVDWWTHYDARFADLVGLSQSTWIYDALLDGLNIWHNYVGLYEEISTSRIAYDDIVLAHYARMSPLELF